MMFCFLKYYKLGYKYRYAGEYGNGEQTAFKICGDKSYDESHESGNRIGGGKKDSGEDHNRKCYIGNIKKKGLYVFVFYFFSYEG